MDVVPESLARRWLDKLVELNNLARQLIKTACLRLRAPFEPGILYIKVYSTAWDRYTNGLSYCFRKIASKKAFTLALCFKRFPFLREGVSGAIA